MLTTEERFCRRLRAALARLPSGVNIPNAPELLEALNELEYLLPDILAEVHREWERDESLDGILPLVARKTAEREAEIFAHCILIRDQTTAPFHLRVQITPDVDEISWLELRLGERGRQECSARRTAA